MLILRISSKSERTTGTSRQVLGIPVHVSSSLTAGTAWAVDSSRVLTVLRDDVRLETDSSRYFDSDRVAVRATMRVEFAFPSQGALGKMTLTHHPGRLAPVGHDAPATTVGGVTSRTGVGVTPRHPTALLPIPPSPRNTVYPDFFAGGGVASMPPHLDVRMTDGPQV
jgi:hypothetical protein